MAQSAAQAVCQQYLEMSDILEVRLDIANTILRSRLLRCGCKDLEHLCKQKKDFAKRVCSMIKKLPGNEITRMIPDDTEALLTKLQQWCVYNCMVKHDLDALVVDEEDISPVGNWVDGLDRATTAKEPAKFTDSADN
jgi:hypothetical protein